MDRHPLAAVVVGQAVEVHRIFWRFRRVEAVVPGKHHRKVAHNRVVAVDVEAVVGGEFDFQVGELSALRQPVEDLALLFVPPEAVGRFFQRFTVEQVRGGLAVHKPDLRAGQPVVSAHVPAEKVAHRVERQRIDAVGLLAPRLRRNHRQPRNHRAVALHHQRRIRRAAGQQPQPTFPAGAAVGKRIGRSGVGDFDPPAGFDQFAGAFDRSERLLAGAVVGIAAFEVVHIQRRSRRQQRSGQQGGECQQKFHGIPHSLKVGRKYRSILSVI